MLRFLFPLLSILFVPELFAQIVPYAEARLKAETFFTALDNREKGLKSGSIARADTFMTFYEPGRDFLKSASAEKEPLFYIFNRIDREGFVIIPAEERAGEVIAWSSSSRMCEIHPEVKVLLDLYVQEIGLIRDRGLTRDPGLKEAVVVKDPLLGAIQWSQAPEPYNALCPYDNATGRRCPAGCVATAMAQVIYYYKYPRSGTGSFTYKSAFGSESADFSAAEYRYDEMGDKPWLGVANPEVAELTYHCAVSVEMEFGPYGSAAFAGQISPALENYFKYKKPALISRSLYTPQAWKALIKNEIDHKRPVVYSALDPLDPEDPEDVASGHAFVVDGYDENELFHINWGWDGCSNGYYSLDLLNPSDCGDIFLYSNNHSVVAGIEPLTPFECLLSADKANLQFLTAGGSQPVAISSNTDWTVTSGEYWITVTPASGKNNGEIAVTAAPNAGFLGRTGTVTLKGCGMSRNIAIVQDGTCKLTLPASQLEFPVSGGSKTDTLASTASWMVTGSPSWITVSPVMGNGNEAVTFTASGNSGSGERTGIITFTGCSVTKSIKVSQQGSCNLSLSSNQEEFPAAGGSVPVTVTSNSLWEVSATEPWVALSPGAGNGVGLLTLEVTANTGPSRRTAIVTVTGCNTTRTIAIAQQGVCSLELTPLNLEFTPTASLRYVTLTATSSWSVVSHDSWITVSPSSGSGTTLLALSVAANASGLPRSGNVVVSGCSSLKTIRVEQKSECMIETSSVFLDFGFMPGSKSLSVNSSSQWTASTDATWISISPKTGSRNGTISVAVQTHTGELPRSGTILLTGCNYSKEIRVEQNACTFSLSEEKLAFSPEPGTKSLVIKSNAQWSAMVNSPWITLSAFNGNRDGTTSVMVEANPSGKRNALDYPDGLLFLF